MRGHRFDRSRNRYNGTVEPVEPSQLPVERHEAYERRNTFLEHLLWHYWCNGVSQTCRTRSDHLCRPCVLFFPCVLGGFPPPEMLPP